jgi:DNA adenine methylase
VLKSFPPSALRGFVGFGCSFDARQPSTGFNFAKGAKNSLLKKKEGLTLSDICQSNYLDLRPKNCLIYCDPPYKETTKYSSEFDSDKFWQTMAEWKTENNIIVVSEYNAPSQHRVIAEFDSYKSMQKHRTEKLFLVSK